ncbi:unnamed protein product, partial [Gulo gulo]
MNDLQGHLSLLGKSMLVSVSCWLTQSFIKTPQGLLRMTGPRCGFRKPQRRESVSSQHFFLSFSQMRGPSLLLWAPGWRTKAQAANSALGGVLSQVVQSTGWPLRE